LRAKCARVLGRASRTRAGRLPAHCSTISAWAMNGSRRFEARRSGETAVQWSRSCPIARSMRPRRRRFCLLIRPDRDAVGDQTVPRRHTATLVSELLLELIRARACLGTTAAVTGGGGEPAGRGGRLHQRPKVEIVLRFGVEVQRRELLWIGFIAVAAGAVAGTSPSTALVAGARLPEYTV